MSLQTEETLIAVSPELLEGPSKPKEPDETQEPDVEQPKEEEVKEPEVEEPKEEESKVEESKVEEPKIEKPKEEEPKIEEPEVEELKVEESKEEEVEEVREPEENKSKNSSLIEPSVPKITPLIYKPKTNNYDSDIECDPFSPFDYGSNEFSINRDQKQENSKSQSLFSFISKKLEWLWK